MKIEEYIQIEQVETSKQVHVHGTQMSNISAKAYKTSGPGPLAAVVFVTNIFFFFEVIKTYCCFSRCL
jgi:hypothetical protein